MIKRILITLLLIVLAFAGSITVYFWLNKSPQLFERSVAGHYFSGVRTTAEESLRQTSAGPIIGVADAYETYAYLGIPYATPPVAELRWRAPQTLPAFNETFSANNYGPPCIQYWGMIAEVEGEAGEVVGSEDCLTLNLWAPRDNTTPKPVMVWIHGGGNDSGNSASYQAHNLAGNHDLVVVTINYRLGLLGWFSHQALRDTAPTRPDASANFGTLDIIAALRWVQNNIASFGGDPNNVTIFGESAGGRNVMSLVASPEAAGLFHKAISQSGTIETTPRIMAEAYPDSPPKKPISGLINSSASLVLQVAEQRWPELSEDELKVKISSTASEDIVSMLRETSAVELMQLASANSGKPGYIDVANVIQDGIVIPTTSTLSLLNGAGNYNKVPLILGTTKDEQKLFQSQNPEFVSMRLGVLPKIKDPDRYELVSEYVSEMWKAGNVDEPAAAIYAGANTPVYAYRFDWDDSPKTLLADVKALLGAAHGIEINFVFGDFEGGMPFGVTYSKANAEGRKLLSTATMDYWAGFAHTGNPGRGFSGQQTEWQAWAPTGKNILLLDSIDDKGIRMDEVRNTVPSLKNKVREDPRLDSQQRRCHAYASLFLHGYQLDDYWDETEYVAMGCEAFPAGEFRER